MKILVDSLPYYYEDCFFCRKCPRTGESECPRYWSKEFICSKENPHECELLKEVGYAKV